MVVARDGCFRTNPLTCIWAGQQEEEAVMFCAGIMGDRIIGPVKVPKGVN